MARKRAVEKSSTVDVQGRLPLLYTSITPITPEQHAGVHIASTRNFDFARGINAVPITADEFAQVQRDYPIVFSGGGVPMPLALVGLRQGVNDHVTEDGSWTPGKYIPAYLRRYPFILVREKAGADRQLLCADMSSVLLSNDPDAGEALITGAGGQSERLKEILDFATRYETSAQRTTALMGDVAKLDLLQASTVNLSKGEKTARIEGFNVISEDKMRALDDAALAGLARRGVLALFTAHHMSLANFSAMGALK